MTSSIELNLVSTNKIIYSGEWIKISRMTFLYTHPIQTNETKSLINLK